MFVEINAAVIAVRASEGDLQDGKERMYFVSVLTKEGRVENLMVPESKVGSLKARAISLDVLKFAPISVNLFTAKSGRQIALVQ